MALSSWILKISKGGNSATIRVPVWCCIAFPVRKGLVFWFFFLMCNLNFIRQYLSPLPLLYSLPLLRRLLLHHCNAITLSHIQPGNLQLSFPAHECKLQPAHAYYAVLKYPETHLSFFPTEKVVCFSFLRVTLSANRKGRWSWIPRAKLSEVKGPKHSR